MKEKVETILDELEAQHNIRILYACESGSRAWGFASPDSDYDVRFIYTHPTERYLEIDDPAEYIELPVNEVLDVNGWELRKALRLFRKSNAPLYEWLQSPIVYRQQGDFLQRIQHLMPMYFSARSGMHHYLSMAHNTFTQSLQGPEVRIKKYFYALRPLLAALAIEETGSVPPMEFAELRDIVAEPHWRVAVASLQEQKAVLDEKAMIPSVPLLQKFIDVQIQRCNAVAAKIPAKNVETGPLNELFKSIVYDL